MPSPDLIKTQNFNGVGAGQTASLTLPPQGIYRKLVLVYTESGSAVNETNMKAAITQIRLKVNGKTQQVYSATQLIALNALHGKSFTAGRLPIYFAQPWRRQAMGEDLFRWGMADVSSFQVEVDIASGRTSPGLFALSYWQQGDEPMGTIVKVRRFNLPVTATGENTWNPPIIDAYSAIHAISSNIDAVRVIVDNVERRNADVSDLHDLLDDQNLTAQSGWTHIVFDASRLFEDVLAMNKVGQPDVKVQDFRVVFDMSSATGFDILTETVGSRD
jgi:hypothetical protein